jgi:hypothetical protein
MNEGTAVVEVHVAVSHVEQKTVRKCSRDGEIPAPLPGNPPPGGVPPQIASLF